MIKYLRYELKRSRSFFLVILFLSLLSVSFISLLANSDSFGVNNKKGSIFILVVAQEIIILIMSLIFFVMRFRRDIFEKSSYITFTINISVGRVLFAKFLASLLAALFSIIVYLLNFLIVSLFLDIKIIFDMVSIGGILLYGFVIILYYAIAYLLLILGLSLSKVKIFKKYYNFVTIVLSILIFSLIIWIFRNIYILSPISLNLRNFSLETLVHVNGIDVFMVYLDLDGKILGINVWTSLMSFFVIAISFFINEYLIEERIDF